MKIIAEVGSNVKTLLDCLNSITVAKACGADVVKFQYFTAKEMYGYDTGLRPIIEKDWIPKLKEKADKTCIEFMCTFFSPESLKEHLPYIDTIKIASSDMLYSDLLEVAKDSGKPIILSTGGQSSIDVRRAMKILKGAEDRLTLMYCESAYPARCTDFNKLEILREIHPRVGFSDHSLEIYTNPKAAKDLGCEVIEKHVDFIGYKDTPDAQHSLSTYEFIQMVKTIKGEEKETVLRSSAERDMVVKHNRRLIVKKDIKQGEPFIYGENFGQFRSILRDTTGLPGYAWLEVDGKIAKKNLYVGQSIGPAEVSI